MTVSVVVIVFAGAVFVIVLAGAVFVIVLAGAVFVMVFVDVTVRTACATSHPATRMSRVGLVNFSLRFEQITGAIFEGISAITGSGQAEDFMISSGLYQQSSCS